MPEGPPSTCKCPWEKWIQSRLLFQSWWDSRNVENHCFAPLSIYQKKLKSNLKIIPQCPSFCQNHTAFLYSHKTIFFLTHSPTIYHHNLLFPKVNASTIFSSSSSPSLCLVLVWLKEACHPPILHGRVPKSMKKWEIVSKALQRSLVP